ncbi:hypothetical protein Val02_27880 [Virgisporangium aliadipatigenens]|uniref:Uncharacterized protein n=1 Tax=Virgisporangium aliadipatigenens TaxID=741659 RepID=A0A8J3YK62_9ACTN|nr:hypothetical protein [Virgisporangium aliadipatigenens]GIJ45902.1 hypothetical protein Val02_27880 [Virgisporangium aliadipatigenens]
MADARSKHLRKVRRGLRGARRWSIQAGALAGASAILVPYAGIGLPDAAWVAAAGGSVIAAVWRWRDYRALAALPVPEPTPDDMVRRLTGVVGALPAGQSALDELRRQRSRLRLRGLAVAPYWQRLDRASVTLTGLAGRLSGPASDAVLEAFVVEKGLRELAARGADVERALRISPAESRPALQAALDDLVSQLADGVTAFERLVAAAAGYVAEDGRLGAKYLDTATARLTEATDLLRGIAAGLAELRQQHP